MLHWVPSDGGYLVYSVNETYIIHFIEEAYSKKYFAQNLEQPNWVLTYPTWGTYPNVTENYRKIILS